MRRKVSALTSYRCPELGREVELKVLVEEIFYRGRYDHTKRSVVACSHAKEMTSSPLGDPKRLGICNLTCFEVFEG